MAEVRREEQSGPVEGPGGSLAVECLPVVMEQIHAEVADAFYSTPRGGVETGGVLYGVRENGRIVILAARPLVCEHAFGPSFVLSGNDRARLTALLEAPQHDRNLAGMSTLGWYHSHTRSELDLTPQDVEIHDRHFPGPGQVALVLRPATMRPTRVCFYFRGADGSLQSSRQYRESASPARMPAARPVEAPRAPDTGPRSLAAPAGSGGPPAATSVQAPEPPRFLALEPPARRRWGRWVLVVVAASLLGGGGWYVFRNWTWTPATELPTALRLQVIDRQGQLEIRWDNTLPAFRDVLGGSLEFVDGSTRRFIVLDPILLRSGSVNYARQSDTVRIHLTVERPGGAKVEELTSFLGQAPPASAAEPTPAGDEAAARQKALEETAAKERARLEREQKLEAQRREDEAKRLAVQKKAPPASKPTPPAPPKTEVAVSRPTPQASPPAPQITPPAQPTAQPPAPESKPVVTAKVEPPVVKPEVPASKPAPPPPAPVQEQPKPAPIQPKPEVTAAKPAAPAPAPLSGEWSLSRSVASGSPFRPDSVALSLSEDGNWVRGTLTGRYRAPRSSGLKPDVAFSFGGPVRAGNMKFPWAAADGSKGEIEFIRVPNNTESLEIVWTTADRKYVFNDVVVRVKKR